MRRRGKHCKGMAPSPPGTAPGVTVTVLHRGIQFNGLARFCVEYPPASVDQRCIVRVQ